MMLVKVVWVHEKNITIEIRSDNNRFTSYMIAVIDTSSSEPVNSSCSGQHQNQLPVNLTCNGLQAMTRYNITVYTQAGKIRSSPISYNVKTGTLTACTIYN